MARPVFFGGTPLLVGGSRGRRFSRIVAFFPLNILRVACARVYACSGMKSRKYSHSFSSKHTLCFRGFTDDRKSRCNGSSKGTLGTGCVKGRGRSCQRPNPEQRSEIARTAGAARWGMEGVVRATHGSPERPRELEIGKSPVMYSKMAGE